MLFDFKKHLLTCLLKGNNPFNHLVMPNVHYIVYKFFFKSSLQKVSKF